jgi:ATP-dependent RNA helicase HelY
LLVVPTLVDGEPNPRAQRFDADPRPAGRGRPRRRYATPSRLEIVDLLDERRLLPVITFVFSRAGCDDAVRSCVQSGQRWTTSDERERIREIVEAHTARLSDDDLLALDHDRWLAGLLAGVAAHHAGMVPPFKEAVETCFVEGLVKVVFATETLALGINMPARSVVIEKLTKFTGEHHEALTPGQYTQLTGRAGRRGLDDHGTAIVLWSPFVPFADVAALVRSREFELTSAFRPTYNMAANLVRRYPPAEAHRLLNLSFAQFRADRDVVRLEARLEKRLDDVRSLREGVRCDRGDVEEYRRLVEERHDRPVGSRSTVDEAMARLKPGDVIWLFGGKTAGPVAVLSVAHRKAGAVRLRVLTTDRRVINLGAAEFDEAPVAVGEVALPSPFAPHNKSFQKKVAERLARSRASRPERAAGDGPGRGSTDPIGAHPVHECPDRDAHVRAARRLERAEREVAELERRVRSHAESLARQFDRVLQLLEAWRYLDGWELTARGEQLVQIFHESDLLLAEAMETGTFDDLDAPALAGLVSCFTYEHRSSAPPPAPWFPNGELAERHDRIQRLARDLRADEARLHLPLTREPDPGFFAAAHAWCAGQPFDDVLAEEELSGGDFVRNTKQLLDLLRQVGDAARNPTTARAARVAVDAVFRGVVAASSAIGTTTNDDLVDPSP